MPVYLQPPVRYVEIEPTELELKCRDIAREHPMDFDDVLYKDAHKDYIELCRKEDIQKIIKEKILDKEDYRYLVVPTYGPSYGEPYRPQGGEPYGNPDLIGVL